LKEIITREKRLLSFITEVMEYLKITQNKIDLIIEKKGEIDLVTEADKTSEKKIIEFILKNFPDDSILGEEGSNVKGLTEFKWIIDPLDGTTNYAHKIPLYAISIGIENLESKEIEFGLIALPFFNDIYTARKDNGAFKNKEKINVATSTLLIESLACTGFPYNRKNEIDRLLKNLKTFLINTRGIRRTGSAALDLAWVAEGKFDIFYETNLNPWDMAAGSILIKEAGGIVSKLNGSEFDIYFPEILSTNPSLHKEILSKFIL
jgi:myo-inositol-1(or 4)-monophosphatase